MTQVIDVFEVVGLEKLMFRGYSMQQTRKLRQRIHAMARFVPDSSSFCSHFGQHVWREMEHRHHRRLIRLNITQDEIIQLIVFIHLSKHTKNFLWKHKLKCICIGYRLYFFNLIKALISFVSPQKLLHLEALDYISPCRECGLHCKPFACCTTVVNTLHC